jgi:hypothetical protein
VANPGIFALTTAGFFSGIFTLAYILVGKLLLEWNAWKAFSCANIALTVCWLGVTFLSRAAGRYSAFLGNEPLWLEGSPTAQGWVMLVQVIAFCVANNLAGFGLCRILGSLRLRGEKYSS